MARLKLYVGHTPRSMEIFKHTEMPTPESHGKQYNAVTGPFRTLRGALAMIHYGFANPHIQCVRDAERIGKQYANDLKGMPRVSYQ